MSTPDVAPNDQAKCPICGQPNECAIAGGRDPESCWCMSVTVDPEALERIPTEAQGTICICGRCAAGSA